MKLQKVFCKHCNKPIYRDHGRINENIKFGHNFYCSRKCHYESMIKRQTVTCENTGCDKVFIRVLNDISLHNYCSQSCAATVNNRKFPKRIKDVKFCTNGSCRNKLKEGLKYCSVRCRAEGTRRYTPEELVKIIKSTAVKLKRIPTKREDKELSGACIHYFGSWNKAIVAAGLSPNRSHNQRMYKRVATVAKDGHRCDSVSEALVDNWLTAHNIHHARDIKYPNTNHKADWIIGNTFVEYFGLAKDSPRYDRTIREKIRTCKKNKLQLIEIYPSDLYPKISVDNKLGRFIRR